MPVITVRIKYHKVSITYSFPFCCGRRGSGLDVMMSALQCTGTTFVLIVFAAGAERRRTFASWIILIGCAKTDEPITGNITESFWIV